MCRKVESQGKAKKNLQLEPQEKKCSDLIEEMFINVKSSSFPRSIFRLTQTKKSCNGRMKYKFERLDNFRSTSGMIYLYNALVATTHILFDIGDIFCNSLISWFHVSLKDFSYYLN